MWEEAEKIELLGMPVYAFGLFAALGALAALIAAVCLTKRKHARAGGGLMVFLAMAVSGFILSRVFYCVLDQRLGGMVPLRYWVRVTAGGFSMFGLLLGLLLGGKATEKASGLPKNAAADIAALCFLAFAVFERIGESFVPDFGISRPLIGEFLKGTFLSVQDDYDAYLSTNLLEAFTAAILFFVLLRDLWKTQKNGKTFLLFLLLFGASQTILESLRFDQHLRVSFVGFQQVMAMALMGCTVLYLARKQRKEKPRLSLFAALSVLLAVGLGVALEFAIDRTNINRYLLYLLFIIVLAVPTALGIRLRREET